MINLGKYSSLIFGFGVNGLGYTCTDDDDQQYGVGAAVNVGTTSLIDCRTVGHTQTLTIGTPVTQTTHWFNQEWQQRAWFAQTSYYYAGTQREVYVQGCHLKSQCDGGTPNDIEYIMPRIQVSVVYQTVNDIGLNIAFTGDVFLPVESVVELYLTDQNGVTKVLSTTTLPANIASGAGGFNPSYDVTLQAQLSLDVWEVSCSVVAPNYNPAFANAFFQLVDTANYLPPYVGDNSFLSFNDLDACDDDGCFCLPVASLDDFITSFQIDCTYTGWDATELAAMLNNTNAEPDSFKYYIGICNDNCELIAGGADYDNMYQPCVLYKWAETFAGSGVLACYMEWQNTPVFAVGTKYRLCLYQRVYDSNATPSDILIDCSNTCFHVTDDLCYTSLINYRNNEDGLCFFYTEFPQNYNTVRLPLYLHSPEFPSKVMGYQKSNGTFVKLSERIDEVYTLETDYMPERSHRCLKFALSHDHIDITRNGQQVEVYNEEPYEIKWNNDTRFMLAMGKTKVKKSLNNCTINSNCK